jgi:hypothetical protein
MASSGRTPPDDAPGTATRDPITPAQLSIVPADRAALDIDTIGIQIMVV